MARVMIQQGDATIEAELSVTELIELAGLNGHKKVESVTPRHQEESMLESASSTERASAFFKALSERGRAFLHFVKAAGAGGVSAEGVAQNMGLKNRYQIGGITGGGLSKSAKRFGFKVEDFYKKIVDSQNGVRTVVFKPGRMLELLLK